MKKLLCITLIALACLSAFGCTQEPSATPNEIETAALEVTPNEGETATPEVTPNEVETITPNEIDVVTPNEPEVPAEPEVPTEPDKNVIILPEADENTKYITIDFPEDFPEEPYTQPNLVSPEEFEWGEYLPFVKYYDHVNSLRNLPLFNYAFLGENVSSIEDGQKIYDELNVSVQPFLGIGSNSFDTQNVLDVEYIEYAKHFSKGKIVNMSEDIDKLCIFYSRYIGPETPSELRNSIWESNYTVYQNNAPVFSYRSPEYILDSPESPEIITKELRTIDHHESLTYTTEHSSSSCVYRSDEHIVFRIEKDHYQVYSLADRRMIYDIKTPSNSYIYSFTDNRILHELDDPYYSNDTDMTKISQSLHIKDVIGDRYILLTAQKLYSRYKFYDHIEDFYSKTYLYDAEKNELIFLENYAFTPKLSPDGKLLVYANSNYEHTIEKQPQGFYVKNLENSATVFYPTAFDHGSAWILMTEAMGFVKRDALCEKIE